MDLTLIILIICLAAVLAGVAWKLKEIRQFLAEVISELKKVSWSTRKDVLEATKVVLVSSILLGVFIGGTDFVLSKLLGLLIN